MDHLVSGGRGKAQVDIGLGNRDFSVFNGFHPWVRWAECLMAKLDLDIPHDLGHPKSWK